MKFKFDFLIRLIIVVILVQTLYFKFTGAPESVYIFSSMGIEPAGRIAAGISELMAALLLLYTPTVAIGAATSLGIMTGALLSHVLVIGIEVMEDGGWLMLLAGIVWVGSARLVWSHRHAFLPENSRKP